MRDEIKVFLFYFRWLPQAAQITYSLKYKQHELFRLSAFVILGFCFRILELEKKNRINQSKDMGFDQNEVLYQAISSRFYVNAISVLNKIL